MKMFKRLTGIFLALCVALGATPLAVFADPVSGGPNIPSDGEITVAGTYNLDTAVTQEVKVKAENVILTGLKDVQITVDSSVTSLTMDGVTARYVRAETSTLALTINGENTLKSWNGSDLTVGGTGTLTVVSTTNAEAVAVDSLTLESGMLKASGSSSGVYARTGRVTVNGGKLEATGGPSTGNSYGISAVTGGVCITNGIVEATGYKAGAGWSSHGIYSYGEVSITGGTVTAEGGEASQNSAGILADVGDITIANCTVIATGGSANQSFGLRTNTTNIRIEGGDVTATGGQTNASNSYGVFPAGNLTVSGGLLTASGNNYGIQAGAGGVKTITFSGGTLIAVGGSGEDLCAASGNHTITIGNGLSMFYSLTNTASSPPRKAAAANSTPTFLVDSTVKYLALYSDAPDIDEDVIPANGKITKGGTYDLSTARGEVSVWVNGVTLTGTTSDVVYCDAAVTDLTLQGASIGWLSFVGGAPWPSPSAGRTTSRISAPSLAI